MKVTVSYQYDSVEEAIQALGKSSGLAKVRRAAAAKPLPDAPVALADAPPPSVPVTDAPGAAPAKRKPGRPRLPKADAPAPTDALKSPPSADVVVDSTSSAGGQGGAEVAPGASASPTLAEVQAAVEGYFNREGAEKAIALLAQFGVARGRDLKPEQYGEFIAACAKVVA